MEAVVSIFKPLLPPSRGFTKTLVIPRRYPLSRSHSSQHNASGCVWSRAPSASDGSGVTVVLLGWYGSKTKHLNKYVEWYNSRAFDTVTFVVESPEGPLYDLGRREEQRVAALAHELASWVSHDDRCFVFHTFCNTGWVAYGAIVDKFRGRQEVMKKIRGCIIDSGGGDLSNPKVFAVGLYIAMFKKRSIAKVREPMGSKMHVNENKMEDKATMFEIVLLFLLEKLFSFILSMPDVHRRLTRVTIVLWKKQPCCPQLYLYSTADKVIPYESIEKGMEEQRTMGIKVHSFNFGLSAHVEHCNTFPDTYLSLLRKFLQEECLKETMPISSLQTHWMSFYTIFDLS